MVIRRNKLLSFLLILSLFVGMVGVFSVDTSYAASNKFHIKKKTVTLVAGKTYQQKLLNKKGKAIKATKVKWKSSNKKVAKVNKKGKITTLKAGTSKMTAKYKGKTYKFTVKVKKPILTAPIVKLTSGRYAYDDKIAWIDIEWKPIKQASKYKVYYSTDGSNFKWYDTLKYGDEFSHFTKFGINSSNDLEGTYYFKVRAFGGIYKGEFSQLKSATIKINKNKTNYSTSDVWNLLGYVGYAQDWGNKIINDTNYWSYDSYDSYSEYVDNIKTDAAKALPYLKKAKAITEARKTRNCNSDQAVAAGFTTWDGMVGSLISQCNSVKNANVESMSDLERMQFAQKALKLSQAINSAYIEIYDY